jgi:ribosomal protein L11
MIEEIIQSITVKINNSKSILLGTGIIWISNLDKKKLFIFTAGHVIYEKGELFKFDCIFEGLEGEYHFSLSDVKFHEKFKKINDHYFFDSAVIGISLENDVNNYDLRLCYMNGEINDLVQSWGYTESSSTQSINHSGIPIKGKIVRGNDAESCEIQVELENKLDQTDRIGEIKGASGAALLQKNGDIIEYYGIICRGHGRNAASNNVVCSSSIMISQILKDSYSIELEIGTGAYDSFSSFVEMAICEFENESVKNIAKASISNIIDHKKITPQVLINQDDDCYNIPTCNSKSKYKCETRWKNKLILISLFNAMGISAEEYQKPIIDIGNSRLIPIDFICSEGSGDGVRIAGLVQSINQKNMEGFNKLRDASTLIWSSQVVPTRKSISKERYSQIVMDISKNPDNIFLQRELDIKNGEKVKNSYSIIHIHKIQEVIDLLDDSCTLEEIVECVKEVIGSVN